MVDLVGNELILNGEVHAIASWQVWWQTPFGLFVERSEAVEKVQGVGMDASLVICPVPVAVVGTGHTYEVVTRL